MSSLGSLIMSIAMFISGAVFQGVADEVEGCDYAKFQGTWKIVSVECGGKKDNQDIDKYMVKFEGNVMTLRERGGEGEGDGDDDEAAVKYELRRGRGICPKRITFGGIGGIYDFKDGSLRICYSLEGDEPMALKTTTERPEVVLMVLKRIGQR